MSAGRNSFTIILVVFLSLLLSMTGCKTKRTPSAPVVPTDTPISVETETSTSTETQTPLMTETQTSTSTVHIPDTPTETPTGGTSVGMDLEISYAMITIEPVLSCFSGAYPPEGTKVVFINNGTQTVSSPFIITAVGYGSITFSASVAPGGYGYVWFDTMYTGSPTFIIDSGNSISEYDESNNTYSMPIPMASQIPSCVDTPTFTPTVTPTGVIGRDLIITNVAITMDTVPACISGSAPPLGTRVDFANNGSLSAGPFVIDLDGNTVLVTGLAAGSSDSIWFPYYQWPSAMTVTIDIYGSVIEVNESNNVYDTPVPIPTPPISCTEVESPTIVYTSTVTATVTISPTVYPTKTPFVAGCFTPRLVSYSTFAASMSMFNFSPGAAVLVRGYAYDVESLGIIIEDAASNTVYSQSIISNADGTFEDNYIVQGTETQGEWKIRLFNTTGELLDEETAYVVQAVPTATPTMPCSNIGGTYLKQDVSQGYSKNDFLASTCSTVFYANKYCSYSEALVAYYDGNDNLIFTEVQGRINGTIVSSLTFSAGSTLGTWHVQLFDTIDTPPSIYDPYAGLQLGCGIAEFTVGNQ